MKNSPNWLFVYYYFLGRKLGRSPAVSAGWAVSFVAWWHTRETTGGFYPFYPSPPLPE